MSKASKETNQNNKLHQQEKRGYNSFHRHPQLWIHKDPNAVKNSSSERIRSQEKYNSNTSNKKNEILTQDVVSNLVNIYDEKFFTHESYQSQESQQYSELIKNQQLIQSHLQRIQGSMQGVPRGKISQLNLSIKPSQAIAFSIRALLTLFAGLHPQIPIEFNNDEEIPWTKLKVFGNSQPLFQTLIKSFEQICSEGKITEINKKASIQWLNKYYQLIEQDPSSINFAELAQEFVQLDNVIQMNKKIEFENVVKKTQQKLYASQEYREKQKQEQEQELKQEQEQEQLKQYELMKEKEQLELMELMVQQELLDEQQSQPRLPTQMMTIQSDGSNDQTFTVTFKSFEEVSKKERIYNNMKTEYDERNQQKSFKLKVNPVLQTSTDKQKSKVRKNISQPTTTCVTPKKFNSSGKKQTITTQSAVQNKIVHRQDLPKDSDQLQELIKKKYKEIEHLKQMEKYIDTQFFCESKRIQQIPLRKKELEEREWKKIEAEKEYTYAREQREYDLNQKRDLRNFRQDMKQVNENYVTHISQFTTRFTEQSDRELDRIMRKRSLKSEFYDLEKTEQEISFKLQRLKVLEPNREEKRILND